MTMIEGGVHPHFLIDLPDRELSEAEGLTHADAAQHIQGLEQGIREDPYVYRAILRALGSAADAGTLLFARAGSVGADVDPDASNKVTGYFRHRLDSHVAFDDSTEGAIAGDASHADRVNQSRKAVSYQVSVSEMSHRRRIPPNAEQRRDAARVSRLASYVEQVIRWQERHEADV